MMELISSEAERSLSVEELETGGGESIPTSRIERSLLLQGTAHAFCVGAGARGHNHFVCRTTCDIGLSSLAGGNDFGLLVAHGIVFICVIS